MTTDDTTHLLEDAMRRSQQYLEKLRHRRVFPEEQDLDRLRKALSGPLPDGPTPPDEVLSLVDDTGSPATVASAGGRYFGFVTGGSLPVSLAANWLANAWDQNCFGNISSPAVAIFEDAVLDWLKQALHLPSASEGALVTGATMANFTCLAAARHHVLQRAGWDLERQGMFGAPPITVIAGEELHGSVLKVIGMLGLGRDRVVYVPADDQGRMRADKLPKIEGPAIVCIQAGNVNSGAFDPAEEIIEKAHKTGAWVHVDGAFGLWARSSARLAHLAAGFERADSWAADAHKWLNVPYDSGLALVRHPLALRAAMSVSGAYLLLNERRNAIDVTPESSRRARAVDIWAVLKCLGRRGLADMIERNVEQAKWLAAQLQDAGIEILNEVALNQIVVSFGSDHRTAQVIKAIQSSGKIWCGGTNWQARDAMRISVSSWATTNEDMQTARDTILEAHRNVA